MRHTRNWAGVLCCSILSIILYLFYILYSNQVHIALGEGAAPHETARLSQAQLCSGCAFAFFCVLSLLDLFLAFLGSSQEGRHSIAWFVPSVGALLCCWGCDLLLKNIYASPVSSAATLLIVWICGFVLAGLLTGILRKRGTRRKIMGKV